MTDPVLYDMIGIGIGPFNLGLAALTDSIESLNCLFLDENPSFNWHPGMMLPWARMQVPFHADLVTLADPCSKYSYLSFLKDKKRLFRFTILEKYFPLRSEYNDYCRWVVRQLKTLKFGHHVYAVSYDKSKKQYCVAARSTKDNTKMQFLTKRIVIGIGSRPFIPAELKEALNLPEVVHSSAYLHVKKRLLDKKAVTVVGAGQSAAEIFFDLLGAYPDKIKKLSWITKSAIFPMDYSKFSCEMTSPEYIDYFFGLDAPVKEELLSRQDNLYKGINAALIDAIYDRLYLASLTSPELQADIQIRPQVQLRDIEPAPTTSGLKLKLFHKGQQRPFNETTAAVVLATGYENRAPNFLRDVKELLSFDPKGQLLVQRNYSIDGQGSSLFIQNAELHTHGFNAADLGLGVYRNAVIINTILRHEYYSVEDGGVFQTFASPGQGKNKGVILEKKPRYTY